MGHPLAFKWLLCIFLICSTYLITATHSLMIPRMMSSVGKRGMILHNPRYLLATDSNDVETRYYDQTLDHFNYLPQSYQKFKQRYLINSKYWGGPTSSAPIFVYLGAEQPIDRIPDAVGFLTDNAASFKALLVYIEHRYYGQSMPFGSWKEASKDASTLGYLNPAQALADYAEVIIHIKKTLHARKSPVIVFGASYGGELATWFRLKYPHLAIGALASSAPILSYDNVTPQDSFDSVITRDFRETSETCYETIRKSWREIERVASQPNGFSILSQRFNTCRPLNQTEDLGNNLQAKYVNAAMYNNQGGYPSLSEVCSSIDGASFGSDILSKIYAGVVAFDGNDTCMDLNMTESDSTSAWNCQICIDLVTSVATGNHSMLKPETLDLKRHARACKDKYGVTPRPHWITTYFGGHDIKLVLKRFGSNIIFSNGLIDPWSSSGILDNISDSLIAIHTINGSHCMDLKGAKETDPEWLVEQRKKEIEIMKGWIIQYYADLGLKWWTSSIQSKP